MPKTAKRLPLQISVNLTPEIGEAMKIATAFAGTSESQYARQAILMTLVSQGFMKHPMAQHVEKLA